MSVHDRQIRIHGLRTQQRNLSFRKIRTGLSRQNAGRAGHRRSGSSSGEGCKGSSSAAEAESRACGQCIMPECWNIRNVAIHWSNTPAIQQSNSLVKSIIEWEYFMFGSLANIFKRQRYYFEDEGNLVV